MTDTDQIRERINIVDLIAESVRLKKAGRNFKGLCPFHNERTPSFIVSPERQIWHCFGCSRGGDAFTFLMELDRIEFPEALKILAERAGVKLEMRAVDSEKTKLKQRLLEIHHLVGEFYHFLLVKHTIGERARLYLKSRGVSDALVNTFGLGFAPNAWENATKFLRKKGFSDKELEMGGVSLRGRSGWYDRFRGRLMFPLKNYRGETIAFAGRLLDPQAKEAKYINSPETPLYTKGQTLYGLEVTKETIRREGSAVVVEGEFDAISSYQAGVANVVAIKGSALTETQVDLLKRFTERIILALDQDAAGDAAMRRGIEIADRVGLDIRVVAIPLGKDPDEAARDNAAIWKKSVKQAVPFYDFLISSALARFSTLDAYSKKKITDEVLPQLAKITNTIVQAHYVKELSGKLALPEEKIVEAMGKLKMVPLAVGKAPPVEPSSAKSRAVQIEERLFSLVVQAKDIKEALVQVTKQLDPSDLTQSSVRRLFIELVDYTANNEQVDLNDFARTLPQELVPTLNRLFLADLPPVPDGASHQKELVRTVVEMKRMLLRSKMRELTTHIQLAEKIPDESLLGKLAEELKATSTALKSLE